MAFYVLRGAFILFATAIAALYVLPLQRPAEMRVSEVAMAVGIAVGVALAMIVIDIGIRRKRLAVISGVFVGLIAGMIVGWALGLMVDLYGVVIGVEQMEPEQRNSYLQAMSGTKIFLGLVTCYWGITLVLQTKGDFRFILPYLEFAKQVRGTRSVLLDSSVIIDGRIVDVIDTQILQGGLIVPKFVLDELQLIADSSDKLRRTRGRRGLEILQKLQDDPNIDISIHEVEPAGANVDQKLVTLAMETQARVMTNDYNLNKICGLRGVDVINLNDVAKALRPVALPGEAMHVRIAKPGEGIGQGVGYLEDGTMVVVEGARKMIGEEIEMTVTSTLQTSAGRMIFGRYANDGPTQAQTPSPA